MTAAVSASGRALASSLALAKPAPKAQRVNVVNGVAKTSTTPSISGSSAVATSGGNGRLVAGSSTSPLTVAMDFVGYNPQGATSGISDINPSHGEMPTISVKAHLIKGFTYSVSSSFSYLRFAKSPTASLSAIGPSDSKAMALNLKGGSFIAKETGDYAFTWSLNNGARFDGVFSASFNGKAPALTKTTGSTNIDALLQRGSAWWHDKGTTPTLGTTQVMAKVFALSSGSSRQALTYSFISAQTVPTDILKNDFPTNSQDKLFAEMDTKQK